MSKKEKEKKKEKKEKGKEKDIKKKKKICCEKFLKGKRCKNCPNG